MARTNGGLVQQVLLDDYGPKLDGTLPVLDPFIATASVIVDQVVSMAAGRGTTLTADVAELIERWLSAHVYVQVDQNYSSKSTGSGASGSFQGQPSGQGFDSSKYGIMAQRLDYSGCLRIMNNRQTAGVFGPRTSPDFNPFTNQNG